MTAERHKLKWWRYVLVALTVIIMQTTYWGEIIPLEEGAGWDGQQYRELVLHVDRMFVEGQIDAYHTHRILPFVLSHTVLRLSGLPPTAENAMTVTIVMNQIVVLLCMLAFFRIADRQRWRWQTELMAFSSTFFTVAVLKLWGYYPFLTDELALLLSLLSCHHYYAGKRAWLFVDGLLAMLTWPMLSLVVLLLLLFPMPVAGQGKTESNDCQTQNRYWQRLMQVAFTLWYPLLFILFVLYKHHVHPGIAFSDMFTLRPSPGLVVSVVAVLATAAFYFVATRWLTFDVSHLRKVLFNWKRLFIVVLAAVAFGLVYKLMEWKSAPGVFSVEQEFGQMAQLPASDILILLESPFIYWGPFFILLIVCWPSVSRQVCRNETVGMLFVVLLGLAFLVDIETRKHISFFPFLLVMVMNCVDNLRLRRWVAPAFAVMSLMMSAWWLKINVAGMQEAMGSYSIEQYLCFPAQRFFMFLGPWQSHSVYLVVFIMLCVALLAVWLLHRFGLIESHKEKP